MSFNILEMLKNIEGMKSKFADVKSQMESIQVVGTAGADLVVVKLNGQFRVLQLTISPEILDKNAPEIVQDLVKAAFVDAVQKLQEEVRAKMMSTLGADVPLGLFGM